MATIRAFTTIEQSRKLAEILPLESADMHYNNASIKGINYADEYRAELMDYNTAQKVLSKYSVNPMFGIIPCWSLAALMNLLPSEFTKKGEYSETTYKIDIRKYALTEDVDIYQIAYGNYNWHEDGSCSWSDMINTGEKENLIDAAFQMICWLKENNLL